MSLISNTVANYIGRIYLSLIGIVILPFYLQYLGAAAFGLIGLFAIMQTLLQLLDMGLTPALSREVAHCSNHENGFSEIKQLTHSLESIFFVISILIVFCIGISNHWIARHWLKIENLAIAEVSFCLMIAGIIISFRWFSELYRAGVLGLEHQVWYNGASIVVVSLQYIGGYVLLRWFTHSPVYFFEYQLLIAIIEMIIFRKKFYKILPASTNDSFHLYPSWKSIKKVLPFASSVAYLSIITILVSQLDKILLSHILPLSIYGYFVLVTVVSSGILQLSAPISIAIMPRMTALLSQGKEQEMLKLYRNSTQIMAVIMLSLSGMIAIFATDVIYIWTGDRVAANWAGPILFWYALGSGVLSVLAFQYYLQYAHGNLKLHVIFNTIFAIVTAPFIFFAAFHYGAKGTAITLFIIELIVFLVYTPIIHHKFAPKIHRIWLFNDILPIFIAVAAMLICIKTIPINFNLISRLESIIFLGGISFIVLMAAALASSTCRDVFKTFVSTEWNVKV